MTNEEKKAIVEVLESMLVCISFLGRDEDYFTESYNEKQYGKAYDCFYELKKMWGFGDE